MSMHHKYMYMYEDHTWHEEVENYHTCTLVDPILCEVLTVAAHKLLIHSRYGHCSAVKP